MQTLLGHIVNALCLATALAASAASTQSYPAKPIRMILPYTPGGGTDLIARPLAHKMSERLGQQVIVDNRGGANGTIGMELAARAPADGYTLVLALTAQLAINPVFYPKLPYNPVRDYVPVALLGTAPYVLNVHPGVPAKTLKELIAFAKAKPGQLTYASSGTGGIPHFAAELLSSMAGVKMLHVPYKGGGPALTDVVAGQVQMNFSVIPSSMPQVKAGRLRALGVTSAKRFRGMPDLPAIAETLPGYEISTWYGVLAPARTSPAVVTRLHDEIAKSFTAGGLADELLGAGFEYTGGGPDALSTHIKKELVKWARIVNASGVTPESGP
jgi:tripartite-type tricarboxylate transporter receptor subunit TctC